LPPLLGELSNERLRVKRKTGGTHGFKQVQNLNVESLYFRVVDPTHVKGCRWAPVQGHTYSVAHPIAVWVSPNERARQQGMTFTHK